jgi:23S rRNA (pseudouridine1915-N3)-methyltransferase
MYRATIRAIGALGPPWKEAADAYATRLRPFVKLTVTELPAARFRSAADRDRVLAEEGARLTKNLPRGARVVALTEHGKEMDTARFAEFLESHERTGQELVFLIGGPLGISDDLIAHGAWPMALSTMTFTHEIARVLLLEQLYRAATILNGKTYHY